jgi:hypothetical protein
VYEVYPGGHQRRGKETMVWEVLSYPNRYTKARLIIPLMKQIFPVLCKRNILRLLTTRRTKYSHLHSEYRNEGNDRRMEEKGSREKMRQHWLGLHYTTGSRGEAMALV